MKFNRISTLSIFIGLLLGAFFLFEAKFKEPASGAVMYLSQIPDKPLQTIPKEPLSISFILEHRTALNGQRIIVRGNFATEHARCDYDLVMCSQRVIVLKESKNERQYTIDVMLLPPDKRRYTKAQRVEIAGKFYSTPNEVGIFGF